MDGRLKKTIQYLKEISIKEPRNIRVEEIEKRISYRFIPVFIITCFIMLISEPKPVFGFYGINWVMFSLAIIWAIGIIKDLIPLQDK